MGFVYFLKGSNSFYKIGKANNLDSRLSGINTSSYDVVQVVTCKLVENPLIEEAKLHEKYKEYTAKGKREWFEFPSDIAIQVCIEFHKIKGIEILTENKQLKSIESKIDKLFNRIVKLQKSEDIELFEHLFSFQEKLKRKEKKYQPIEYASPPTSQTKIITKYARPNDDEIYKKAIELIHKDNRASASHLQLKLSIGYVKAARILDRLELEGYVSPANGAMPREILK